MLLACVLTAPGWTDRHHTGITSQIICNDNDIVCMFAGIKGGVLSIIGMNMLKANAGMKGSCFNIINVGNRTDLGMLLSAGRAPRRGMFGHGAHTQSPKEKEHLQHRTGVWIIIAKMVITTTSTEMMLCHHQQLVISQMCSCKTNPSNGWPAKIKAGCNHGLCKRSKHRAKGRRSGSAVSFNSAPSLESRQMSCSC